MRNPLRQKAARVGTPKVTVPSGGYQRGPEEVGRMGLSGANQAMRRVSRLPLPVGVVLLAVLGTFGERCAGGAVVSTAPAPVVLSWNSLGPGTQYSLLTSTDLVDWTLATNTTATSATLSLSADPLRSFSLQASSLPPQSVTLAWNPPPPSADIAGYFIYYGAEPGKYTNQYSAGLSTSGVISNLVAGTTYYFAATAYTAIGLESDLSPEVVWKRSLRLQIQRSP